MGVGTPAILFITIYRHNVTILALAIFACFEIINKSCFISLFMITYAIESTNLMQKPIGAF